MEGFKKDDLMHYGRKGMRWGVMNGPPYPLGQSNAEYKRNQETQSGHKLSYTKGKIQRNAKELRDMLGAAFIPGYYEAYMISNVNRSVQSSSKKDKSFYESKEGKPEKLSELKKKTYQTTAKEDMKKVNPRKMFNSKGTYNNCVLCSVALDMRRRGYDVQARKTDVGYTDAEITKMYKGAQMKKMMPLYAKDKRESIAEVNPLNAHLPTGKAMRNGINEMGNVLEKEGPNARGIVCVTYANAFSAHAMFWENDANGQLTIYDGQSKTVNPNALLTAIDPMKSRYIRTDTLQPASDIGKYVVSVDREDIDK